MAFFYYLLNQVHAIILVIEIAVITDGWYHRRLVSQTAGITDSWYHRPVIFQTANITDTSTHTQTCIEYQNVKHDKNMFVCHKTMHEWQKQ